MIGFIVAIIAGFLTPLLEAPIVNPLVKALEGNIKIEPNEHRLIAFMIAMIIAGLIAALISSGTAFWIIFGGILGYFGKRLFAAAKQQIDDHDEDA